MDLAQDREILDEFLVETSTNLSQLDLDLVELEQRPDDGELMNRIFRTIHTVKGTCGFLGLSGMEQISHVGENVLNRLRNRELRLNPMLVSLILDLVDALRVESASLQTTSKESGNGWEDLVARLKQAESMPATAAGPEVAESLAVLSTNQKPAAPPAPEAPDTTIRIDVGLADKLVNLVGELVLVRNQMLESGGESQARQRLNLITSELQESVMKTRMQPVSVVWNKLPRVVRDLGAQLGKQIQLVQEGSETEMDRGVIEAIRDPLTHIVRNSCDHGLERPEVRRERGKPEAGTLRLKAYQESGQVVIEVADDGAGINGEKVRNKALEKGLVTPQQVAVMSERQLQELVFLPGFSTADTVSSISGRGVGMDVVRRNIQRIGGSIELASQTGAGTLLRIRIPLTLAIIPGLLVTAGGQRFVIPQASLVDLVRASGAQVPKVMQWVDDNPVFRRNGRLWPLLFLKQVLGMEACDAGWCPEVLTAAFVEAKGRRFGLVVDAVQSMREIVVKPLGRKARGLNVYAGATILDDGNVALILDIAGLAQKAALECVEAPPEETQARGAGEGAARRTMLLVEAGEYKVLSTEPARLGGELPAIVVSHGAMRAALVVDRIRDIRSAGFSAERQVNHPAIECSAVFDGQVCDVLDLKSILEERKAAR
ncbi:MAG: chemotaxis protein CheA [Acidobacteria bacterium]|nr:chemotaxis protein CheA [Acidobacteriota bacterium]